MEKLLMDIEELAKILGVKVSTIYSSYESMGIPYIKEKGLGLKFPIHKVQLWIESNIKQGIHKKENRTQKTKWQQNTKIKKAVSISKQGAISTQLTSPSIKSVSGGQLALAMREKRILNSKK